MKRAFFLTASFLLGFQAGLWLVAWLDRRFGLPPNLAAYHHDGSEPR